MGYHWADIVCHVCWAIGTLFWFRLLMSFIAINMFELLRRAKLTEVCSLTTCNNNWTRAAMPVFYLLFQEWADTLRHGRDRQVHAHQTLLPPAQCAVTASASCHHPVTRVCCLTLPPLQLLQHGHAPHVQRGRHELVLLPRGALAAISRCASRQCVHGPQGSSSLSFQDARATDRSHLLHIPRACVFPLCARGASTLRNAPLRVAYLDPLQLNRSAFMTPPPSLPPGSRPSFSCRRCFTPLCSCRR